MFFFCITTDDAPAQRICMKRIFILSAYLLNRMLISQLKRFLGVKFMFPPGFNV